MPFGCHGRDCALPAESLVPGSLARFNLVQNVVSQLRRCLMCDVGNADTSRRHIHAQAGELFVSLVARL